MSTVGTSVGMCMSVGSEEWGLGSEYKYGCVSVSTRECEYT